jgi:hypothetical protein
MALGDHFRTRNALVHPVEAIVTSREQWEGAYRKLGFSDPVAVSYTRMTGVRLYGGFDYDERSIRCVTTLNEYIRQLVA